MSCSTASTLVKRIAIPIARFSGTAAPASGSVVLWMTNPSALLIAQVAIVPMADRGSAFDFASATWNIRPALPASTGDLTDAIPLANVFASARALPDAFVIDDPTKLVKLSAALAALDDGTTGTAWAIATWEGKDACLAPELRAQLFALCDLSLQGGGAGALALRAGAPA
jgi:hypothetical protein